MFRIESYITPIIWSYFSKYVKNFNSHDFQVSLWNGGAVFSNLELNLDVLDSELQIPLTFASGHIQELKITVPWRKITSEPIVLNVKSMELVLRYKDVDGDVKPKKSTEEIMPGRDVANREDDNAGYMRSLIAKIVTNVRVNFENVVIKYVESDIAFSVNVGEACLTAADEDWKHTFIDRIAYSPDFILRKKLSFSDVNICLDRCNNAGVVDKFQDPMLYRCDFDVRIIQKFATTYSRTPYFYRMDLFLGHLQFCVTDEQIPMLVRLYNLFTFLMQSADTSPDEADETISSLNDTGNETTESDSLDQSQDKVLGEESKDSDMETGSWTGWAASWLYTIPTAMFGDDEESELEESANQKQESTEEKTKPPTPPPLPPSPSPFFPRTFAETFQLPPPTTHFGVYIKTLTIIFKAVQRSCDKPHFSRRRIISIYPFLKCSIQGICCDFIMRGNENSHALGVSSIMVHGLGFCPCGVHDCTSSTGGIPSQGGECYFEAGKITEEFAASSLFQPDGVTPTEWCYKINHKDCLNYQSENALLQKTPAFFLKYIVTRSDVDKNNLNIQNPEISEILYHCVTAPCKVLLCSGLLHRLKMIHNGIANYGYRPLGFEHLAVNIARYGVFSPDMKYPLTTYRLVIRQPLIEILAADHPSDYSPQKRAEYYRKSGGLVVPPESSPRLSPDWPRMIISCDMLECTAVDADDHFFRLRSRFLEEPPVDTNVNNNGKNSRACRKSQPTGEEMSKWMNQKTDKKATFKLTVMEVLLSFVSEPVELNVGVKAGILDLEIENSYFYSQWEIIQKSKGNVYMDSVTCSTRLQQRSNVLWLPFTVKIDTLFDWEPSLIGPSLAIKVGISSLTLFVGPETLIAFTQLSQKLSVYLQEFIPRHAPDSQLIEASANPPSTRMCVFVDNFGMPGLELHTVSKDIDCIPQSNKGIGICTASQSLVWKYPQKRTLRALAIETLPFPFEETNKGPFRKFHVEYCQDFTKRFHTFATFTLAHSAPGRGRIARFANELERHGISATIWRLRIDSPDNLPNVETATLEALAKTIVVESSHFSEFSVMMELCDVNLNLVNNTFYAGKEIGNSVLQSYVNTDGVSPDDHIMATLHFKQSTIYYSAIEKIARFNADFTVHLKILDYESLVLEEIIEPVVVGLVMMVPDANGNCSLNLVTDNVNLKIGASMIHSVMYSSALWYQVINSFDPRLSKMVATETQEKIILNRILMCNDLNVDIQLNCSHPESLGGERIPSRDCKAISVLSSNDSDQSAQLHLSFAEIPDKEVEIDVYKAGYSIKRLCDNKTIFVNVSSLTTSQKLVKVSGSLILANGLEQAVEMSLFPYSSLQAVKSVLPSHGIGPTYFYTIHDIEHFRFRFVSSGTSQNPWSEVLYTNDLIKEGSADNVSSVLVALFQQTGHSISKTQVWLTLVPERLQGQTRYLLVVSPIYCLRSWLCGDTYVHLTSENNKTDMYSLKGKGSEIQIKFEGENDVAHHMKFQSNLNVPPSAASVPLLPSGPMLEKTKLQRPIDELLAQITNVATDADTKPEPGKENTTVDLKWPFITEDIDKKEWNTEINPETEIMVTFTPWVEGLPTAVADVRPWALFINLSGVELLFAQEVCNEHDDLDDDWDQFWVPYKCVFSPKPIKIPSGKFRLGIMMNDFLVKSPSLQFSDQPERLSVKKINKDGKVPIDCYSRLDLFGGSQVACLTIETRVRNKILIMTVRPTYSIQNRAPFEVYAEGVTISSAVPQRRESWTDARLSMFSTLEPFTAGVSDSGSLDDMACTAMPILHFTTDGQDYSASTPSYKYLALSCGGPWWFVQLVDCSESAHAAEGIPGTKCAVTLPKVDCSVLSPLFRHKLNTFKVTTEAVVVGSYTKNGQVWVSISQNNAPQVMFHNKSALPLFYAEKVKNMEVPKHHTSCFEQYLMVPPKSSCHFSFANAYSIFPQLNKRESPMPEMMMAEVSQDLVDFVTSHQTTSFVTVTERPRHKNKSGSSSTSSAVSKSGAFRYPSGNMLFPDFDIEWQRITNVDSHPTQYARFGKQSVKVSVEIVGYTHHVFIENTNLKEVSAKAVRSRFSTRNSIKPPIPVTKPEDIVSGVVSHSGHTAGMRFSTNYEESSPRDVTITIGELEDEEEEVLPIATIESGAMANKLHQQWRIKAIIPELYISIQDDFDCGKEVDRECLGLAFEPIILEQVPIFEDSKLRPAECPRKKSWVYACRIGNMQVDTPSISTRRPAEFSVMLEPVKKSNGKVFAMPNSSLDVPSFIEEFEIPTLLNIDSTITLTRVAPNEINLETVWLKVMPFSLYVEDRLLSYVLPSMHNILAVFNEGYILMDKCATTGASKMPDNENQNLPLIDPDIMKQISIGPSLEYPSIFYHDAESSGFSGVSGQKRGNTSLDQQSLFSRSITFAPTQASSSSGLNSSSSSVISSSVSNLRLASVSPPPPSPMTPLEPHGSSSNKMTTFRSFMTESAGEARADHTEVEEEKTNDPFAVSRVPVPKELIKLFEQLSRPVRVKVMEIHGSELELTLRTEKLLYVALDRSVVQLKPFKAYSSVTTDFHLALELTMHYTVGTIFTIGNPVRVLGSLELLGSPGTLARTVGTGLRDLVVYPCEGILNGPVGFVSGLGYGMTSFVRSVTSGTLVSLTNWAESVSRNIDRLTLDQQEQLITEAERQVELQGFTDGFVHGLSGFGIRMLGAIGGLTHHPIKNVIHRGPTTTSVISGVSRGVFGAVVKPIGGVAELISMTGQGVLLATGWKPKPKVKKPKAKKSNYARKSSNESS